MSSSLFQNLASAVRPRADEPVAPASSPKPVRSRQVLYLPIAKLEPDPGQPRQSFPDLDELAQSIRAMGVRQPLLVRKLPEEPGRYRLVAGERRFRAARLAGLSELPCLVEEGEEATDLGQLRALQLVENLQRRDLTPVEIANAIQSLLEHSDLCKGQIARLIGKAPAYISKHLALLQAEGPAAEALAEGLVRSTETYRLFSHLPEERQQEILTQARDQERPIARGEVEAAAELPPDLSPPPAAPLPAPPPAPDRPRSTKVKRAAPDDEAEPVFTLRLTGGQIVLLLLRLKAEVPEEPSQLPRSLMAYLKEDEQPAEGPPGGSG